ncbi:MAG: glucose-6-phosphate isomerase [Wenzhouxiangellaceae bacterium]
MSESAETTAHHLLQKHNSQLPSLARLLNDDSRNQLLTTQQPRLLLDASRLPLDATAWQHLLTLSQERQLTTAIAALYRGEAVNRSENRPALHMALRAADPAAFLPAAQAAEVITTRSRMLDWVNAFSGGRLPGAGNTPLRDIIHLGIGGSDLGSRLLADALPTTDCQPRLHFISAPDPSVWQQVSQQADPASSAVIVTTKSFRTVETLTLARAAREWLGAGAAQRMFAVTSASKLAIETLGITESQILPMWDWVGGRFSLWSAAGIMGAIAIGANAFTQLLQGAAEQDQLFHQQNPADNLSVRMALYDYWLHSIQNYPVRGIYVYDQRLRLAPAWLSQLEMESLGKRVDQNNQPLDHSAAPILVGGSGPDAQHATFQALHQGTRPWPVELVGVRARDGHQTELHRLQWASMLAQAQALTHGSSSGSDPMRTLPGGRPVMCWQLEPLTPATLGAWLAAYEHKVYALATLWNINPFDQWGVEEGKRLADKLLDSDPSANQDLDPVTQRFLQRLNW